MASLSSSYLVVNNEDVSSIARTGRPVCRRPSWEEGHALEILGHAVEYLVDSRAFSDSAYEEEAIDLLKRANRQVFLGCKLSWPIHDRVRLWLDKAFNVIGS